MFHGRSGQPVADPLLVAATLQKDVATANTPLAAVPHGSKWRWISSTYITTAIHLSARSMVPLLGIRL